MNLCHIRKVTHMTNKLFFLFKAVYVVKPNHVVHESNLNQTASISYLTNSLNIRQC